MAVRRPQWILDLMEEQRKGSAQQSGKVPEQMTILRRGRGGPPPQVAPVATATPGKPLAFTGLGENGRLDRELPTQFVAAGDGTHVLHEGETITQGPEGSINVLPSNSPLSQAEMAVIEKEKKLPGHEFGVTGLRPVSTDLAGISGNLGGYSPSVGWSPGSLDTGFGTVAPNNPLDPKFGTIAPNNSLDASFGDVAGWTKPWTGGIIDKSSYPVDASGNFVSPDRTTYRPISTSKDLPWTGRMGFPTLNRTGTPTPVKDITNEPFWRIPESTPLPDTSGVAPKQPAAAAVPPQYVAPPNLKPMTSEPAAAPAQYVAPLNLKPMTTGAAPAQYVAPPNLKPMTMPAAETPAAPPPEETPAPVTTDNAAVTPKSAVDTGMARLRQIAAGMSQVDRTLMERYIQEFNASAGAERVGVMHRAAADPNLSEGARRAMVAEFNRDVSTGRSEMLSKLSLDAAQRAQAAAEKLVSYGMQQQEFDFAKQKYGDEATTRMAADIANGLDFGMMKDKWGKQFPNFDEEDFKHMYDVVNSSKNIAERSLQLALDQFDWEKQKYGDDITEKIARDIANGATYDQIMRTYGDQTPNFSLNDFNHMDRTLNYDKNRQQRDDAFNDTKGYIAQKIATDPNWYGSGAWKTDAEVNKLLTTQWQAEGHTSPFDLNQVDCSAWAATQVEGATITPYEAEANKVRASSWYRGLTPERRDEVDLLMNFANEVNVTGGYKVGMNLDGTTYIMDANGEVVYGKRVRADGQVGDIDNDTIADAREVLEEDGLTGISNSDVAEYMEANNGAAPPNARTYQEWRASHGSRVNVMNYLNGITGVTLTQADRTLLSNVSAAYLTDEGDRTPEQDALVEQFSGINFAKTDAGSNPNGTTPIKDWYVSQLGYVHSKWSINTTAYGSKASGTKGQNITLTSAMRSWAQANAGSYVQIDGKWYQIDSADPITTKAWTRTITSGQDTRSQNFSAEAINLVDPESGETLQYTFGSEPSWED